MKQCGRYSKLGLVFAFLVWALNMTGFASAEIPQNIPENSFHIRVAKAINDSTGLIDKGLREVRETFATDGGLVSVESKNELLEGADLLDQAAAWSTMYTVEKPADVPRFSKLTKLIKQKQQAVRTLLQVVGGQTKDLNAVARLKQEIKSLDKKIRYQLKVMNGKISLIIGKPLPPAAEKL